MLVYVGTYTRTESKGIYVYRMDEATGELSYLSHATGIENPTFLAIHPNSRYLYAVSEVPEYAGRSSGAIMAYYIEEGTGGLTYINERPTGGPGPCHVAVDATGRFALVANYLGGSVCVLPIGDNGSLGKATDFVQHEGSSVDPRRQGEPHAHSVNIDDSNKYVFVADLGTDKVVTYLLDAEKGKLTPNDVSFTKLHDGAGPRHLAFHPNGKSAYLINELDSTITAFALDSDRGALDEIQTLPTLPEDFSGTSHCADIHVSPSGSFLYGSNRGHDSIAIYSIDGGSGKLTFLGHEPTGGRTPRNFAIDPTGAFLLAANQDSGSIVTFRIDGDTGLLSATGASAAVPMPVCLKFLAT